MKTGSLQATKSRRVKSLQLGTKRVCHSSLGIRCFQFWTTLVPSVLFVANGALPVNAVGIDMLLKDFIQLHRGSLCRSGLEFLRNEVDENPERTATTILL